MGRILKTKMTSAFLGILLLSASAAMAQEEWPEGRHEVSLQGAGFFTKDSGGNGNIAQHTTDSFSPLITYRYHFTRLLGADATYGYTRNTLQSFAAAGPVGVQTTAHQVTGALVVTLPWTIARLTPYALAGGGAFVFDPKGLASGSLSQTKPAFLYGGGADYAIARHVALRVEYRGFVYGRPDFGLNSLPSGVTTHTAQPSAGIVFRL